MKKLVFYAVMTFCGLLNVSAGCSDKKEKAPEPDNSALLGYWKIKGGYPEWKKRDGGDWERKGTVNPGTFAYEFFADKSFISYDLKGNFPAVKGTWKLDVKTRNGKDIALAYIYLYSDTFKNITAPDIFEKDGSMKFLIAMETVAGEERLEMTSKDMEVEDNERYSHTRNYFVFSKGK